MKLQNKTSLYYFLWLIPILFLSGVALYSFLQQKVTDSIDDSLRTEKLRIDELLLKGWHIAPLLNSAQLGNELQIDSFPANKNTLQEDEMFSDTSLFNKSEGEVIPYRELTSYYEAPHISTPQTVYRVILRKSYLETEDLIQGVVFTILFVFIFLLAVVLIINRWTNRTLWSPFYKSLSLLDNYDLEKGITSDFEKTSIDEFKKLNDNLNAMSKRIVAVYNEQKQFIENASHEMQTPLAVIHSKTDILLQSKNIREEETEIIQSILNATTQLAQLNKTLLLLSKIENNQFASSETVDVQKLVEQILQQFEDMITLKNITIEKEYKAPLTINLNRSLAEILLMNLFQNAIQHNLVGGKIMISINDHTLKISNTGVKLKTAPEELFNRFKKDDPGSDTTGLGLAIVKQICHKYNLKVSYRYEEGLHTVTIAS